MAEEAMAAFRKSLQISPTFGDLGACQTSRNPC